MSDILINPQNIRGENHLKLDLPDGKVMLVLTGVVIIDYKATNLTAWNWDTHVLSIPIPGASIAQNKVFDVDQVAPYATLSSIESTQTDGQGALAAWAVDEFFIYGVPSKPTDPPLRVFLLRVGVKTAIQRLKSSSVIYRLAYHVTTIGHYDEVREGDIHNEHPPRQSP